MSWQEYKNKRETKSSWNEYKDARLKRQDEIQRARSNNVTINNSNNKTSLWDNIQNIAKGTGNITNNLWQGLKNGTLSLQQTVGRAANNTQAEQIDLINQMNKKALEGRLKDNPKEAEQINKAINNPLISGDQIRKESEEYYNKIQENKNINTLKIQENTEKMNSKVGKYLAGEIAPSIGQMLPGMVGGPIGSTYFIGSATGNYYDDAKQRGMSEDQATMYSGVMGIIEGTLESIGAKLTTNVGKQLFKKNIKGALVNYGLDIGENFLEESIVEPISELVAQTTAGKDKADWSDMGRRMWESGIAGAITSVITGGASGLVGGVASNVRNNKYTDINTGKVLNKDSQNWLKQAENIINTENTSNLQQKGTNNQNILPTQQLISQANKVVQNRNIEQKNNIPMRYKYEATDNNKINNLRQDMSKYWINSEETKALGSVIEKVINDKGYNIRLDETINDNRKMANAQIRTLDNGEVEIRINPNSKNIGEFLLTHEITHAIGTQEMRDLVLKYASKNKEFSRAVESLKQNYNTNEISDEVLSDVSAQLFGNQEFINSLVMENTPQSRNIIKTVYENIKRLLKNLTEGGRYKNFVQDLESKWRQAYQTQYNNLDGNTKYSIAGKNALENLKTQPNLYNEANRMYKQAQKMFKEGANNKEIFEVTGWYKDENGKMKFSFSDKDMDLKNRRFIENKKYTLEEVLDHNTLFMFYPQLRNYEVRFLDLNKNNKTQKGQLNGSFNAKDKRIRLDINRANNKQNTEGTLIHEIQHAIQDIERFSRGTSAKLGMKQYKNSKGEIEARDTSKRFIDEKYNKKDLSKNLPESSKYDRNVVEKMEDALYNYFNRFNGGDNYEIAETNKGKNQENIHGDSGLVVDREHKQLNNKQENLPPVLDDYHEEQYASLDNNQYSLPTKEWQQHLQENYKPTGTRTKLSNIKLPTKQSEIGQKEFSNQENIKNYSQYKKNIIQSNEQTINNLITYKNEAIRNINNKIVEKNELLKNKTDKSTKVYSQLQQQIENLKARKVKIENEYNLKIEKFYDKNTKERLYKQVQNEMKKHARETIADEISPLIEDLTSFKDKSIGWFYNRETAQRNIEDIVKDKELAKAINETLFDPVQKHQAQKTRDINQTFQIINELELNKKKVYDYEYALGKGKRKRIKIDEATLAQLYIEKKMTMQEITSKYGVEADRIQNIADTFNNILSDLYNQMNEETVKYGYSPIGKIENYFPHFFDNKPDTVIGKIASYFGLDLTDQSLSTSIAGITEQFKPGRTWNSNIQQRKTNRTDYDALKALEKYIQGAYDIVYTTEDIQKLREFSRQMRYKYSDKGIQENIDRINNNTDLTQEEKDFSLDALYQNYNNQLPNFVTWIDEYTNVLSNKKSSSDRSVEKNIGRNIYTSMSDIEGRIASNIIGGNLSVSITNFAPIFQAIGTTNPKYVIGSMLNVIRNDLNGFLGNKDTSFVNNSTFLTNRFETHNIAQRTVTENVSDYASFFMNAVDEFTSETVVRAKYLENISKGMTEEQALENADKYASRLMADRSKGALPIAFNSKNPIAKLINMFQVEVNNTVSNYSKDMARDSKSKSELVGKWTKLSIASWCLNTIAMSIKGGNEILFDPIRIVSNLAQLMFSDDEDKKEEAKNNLTEHIIGIIPFATNVAGLLGYEDVGRVPISNAMPNLTSIVELFDNENSPEYKKEIAIKELSKPLYYLGIPTGGAQIKKTIEGIITVNKSGSYKTNKKGEKQLQFPITDKSAGTYLKASVFGKWSLPTAQDYSKTLSAKQTKMSDEFNVPYKELVEYSDAGLKNNADKINYINSRELTIEQKWGVYKYDIFSDTKREDGSGSQLDDIEYIISNGVSKKDFIEIYNKAQKYNIDIPTQKEYKELKDSGISLKNYIDYKIDVKTETERQRNSGNLKENENLKQSDKIQILLASGYTNKEKEALYENYIGTNDDTYKIFDNLSNNSNSINAYLKYKQQEFEADKKDDGTVAGQATSGSKKKKVYEYINNKNNGLNYNQRLLLIGLQYKLQSNERDTLYKAIKNNNNIPLKEKLEIYEKLKGFTVYKDGKVKY